MKTYVIIRCTEGILKTQASHIILLCNFHVIKYLKNLISTALVTVEVKNDLMDKFKRVIYATSEEDYEITR